MVILAISVGQCPSSRSSSSFATGGSTYVQGVVDAFPTATGTFGPSETLSVAAKARGTIATFS
jgi:hypothetical protein